MSESNTLKIRRRGETQVQDNGVWAGCIGFQAPWAHPIWSEYLLFIYDLNVEVTARKDVFKRDPSATHEFMLFAIDPDTPIDFDNSLFDQKNVSPLHPANYAYQFKAESNQAAWDRINSVIDKCFIQSNLGVFMLNPDTDYRAQWDAQLSDMWTLHNL